jgi:alpha-methylacyl-CoA racemase
MSASTPAASGPLAGVRIIEIAGIGPSPLACLLLSDLGAEIVRVERVSDAKTCSAANPRHDVKGATNDARR